MPHTAECRAAVAAAPVEGEDWCVGAGCIITREDAPTLADLIDEGAAEAHARGQARIADLRRRRDTPDPPEA